MKMQRREKSDVSVAVPDERVARSYGILSGYHSERNVVTSKQKMWQTEPPNVSHIFDIGLTYRGYVVY